MVQSYQNQLIQLKERYAEEREEKRQAMDTMQLNYESLQLKLKSLEKVPIHSNSK